MGLGSGIRKKPIPDPGVKKAPDLDPGGGGVGQPKMCIPPGKILGTPLVRAIPGSTRRRIARRLQNRIQIMF